MQEINIIPPIILAIVFTLITIRQVGNIRLAIWQIMLLGGVAAVLTGSIRPFSARAEAAEGQP